KFDSSKDRNVPYTFVLGRGEVIKGWDEGIQSMKVGGKRRLIVPPKLGYGKKGAGNVIPPDATLIFEVELIEIRE
ncbi:MAG TPA: FKBP-type peptidyl-prolyl cis-trans isomerase, partial [Geobacteraceae bacterium]|nr:FKBP-type peptidyl-prolyl cis-trans isomerase [Geobacteraceae bacterium]